MNTDIEAIFETLPILDSSAVDRDKTRFLQGASAALAMIAAHMESLPAIAAIMVAEFDVSCAWNGTDKDAP